MKFIESANEYFGRYEGFNPKTQAETLLMAKIPAVPQQELSRISKFPSRRQGLSAGFPAGYIYFLKKPLKIL